MARTLTAYVLRSGFPPRAALQAAIDALHFPLKLDADYVPFETAGYLPCALDGEDAGFDLRFNAPTDVSSPLEDAIGARDTALSVKWSSDPREEGAALMFCAALANAFGALVHDPAADTLLSSDQLAARARAALA